MHDNREVTTVVDAVASAIAVIFVALRLYSRHFTQTGYGWDDWLILFVLVPGFVSRFLAIYAFAINPAWSKNNYGADPNHVFTPTDVLYAKLCFFSVNLYYSVSSAIKLSILLMYGRIFSISASFRHSVAITAALVVGFWIGCTVADLLICIPLERAWLNNLYDPRYCFNFNIFWLTTGIVEVILDVIIIILPIRVLLGLQLSKGKKIAVLGVFLLGFFVIISGIVKTILSYAPGSRLSSAGNAAVWTTVHLCTGVICACLPVCWPVFLRLARLSPSTWPVVSSIRRRWYSLSSGSSMDRSARRTTTPDSERNVDSTGEGYQLPVYRAEKESRVR